VRYRDQGIVGLGLGGMEAAGPAAPFARAFAIARDGGLALVPHAGEAAGPDRYGRSWEDPARIRHGIRAVEDSGALAEIVDRGIVPTCARCRTCGPGWYRRSVPTCCPRCGQRVSCTINTDDPAMFSTDLGREYALAEKLG
jgi:aminodeoxyfutalosine deaminase